MQKLASIAAGVTALALMGSELTVAGAGAGAGTDTISVVENAVDSTVIDQGPSGPGIGDVFVVGGRLFEDGGTRVGVDGSSCTVTSDGGKALCGLTLRLSDGQITAQGLIRSAHVPYVATMAVTGGTGAFAGAGGSIRLEQTTHDEPHITVRLLQPTGS